MKKVFLLSLTSLFFLCSKAQFFTLSATVDTVKNAQPSTLSTGVQNGKFEVFTLQVDATKQSGAPDAVIRVYGSTNNVGWDLLSESDTIANASGVQTFAWTLGTNQYLYYKIVTTAQSGTSQSTLVRGYLWRPNN